MTWEELDFQIKHQNEMEEEKKELKTKPIYR